LERLKPQVRGNGERWLRRRELEYLTGFDLRIPTAAIGAGGRGAVTVVAVSRVHAGIRNTDYAAEGVRLPVVEGCDLKNVGDKDQLPDGEQERP
jgi:hypothetical protein